MTSREARRKIGSPAKVTWKVELGEWRVELGEWRVELGEWRDSVL